jgi:hypothetical protein
MLDPMNGDSNAVGDDGAKSIAGVYRAATGVNGAESTARDTASGAGSSRIAPTSLT